MSDFLIGPAGRRVCFADPFGASSGMSPARIVREVATGLSREQRFSGSLRKPYSVLQHSLAVAKTVQHDGKNTRDLARRGLAALMHDASEAYLRDIPKPLKALLSEYRRLEKHFQESLFGALSPGISFSLADDFAVIDADAANQLVEADFLGFGANTYGITTDISDKWYDEIERTISEELKMANTSQERFVRSATALLRDLGHG